jgi:tetratricopeptide (TPR) repeat protein
MKKIHSLVWIGLLPAFVLNAYALTPQEIYQKAQQQVLVLEVLNEKGVLLSAHTALLLDNGKAVTQCDSLEGAASYRLRQLDIVYSAKPGAKDINRNLCVLTASEMSAPYLQKLRDSDPKVGTQVYALSNALGYGINITEGVVSGIRKLDTESLIQFTAAIAPGSEGGGLFDADGYLVGIITYRKLDGQNVNFALPARWLNEVEQRSESTGAAEAWRFKAFVLTRELKWAELAEHALNWTHQLNDSAEAWWWYGFAEEQLKNWVSAEHAYRQAQQRDPGFIQAGIGLATALSAQQKHREALDVVHTLLAYHQEDARIWLIIANEEAALNHKDEAKKAFAHTVQIDSRDIQALTGLAKIARLQEDWNNAVSAMRQVVKIEPLNTYAWIQLSLLYSKVNRPERAFASAEHAIELAPHDGDAWVVRGMALEGLKRHHEAIDSFIKGIDAKPKEVALAWEWLASIYHELGLIPEAVSAFRQALQLAPNDDSTKIQFGLTLEQGNRFDDALALFEKLKTSNLKDPVAWRQIGYVYSFRGQDELAIPAFEESLKLDQKQPKVWYSLMRSYHVTGRKDDENRVYPKLLSLDKEWSDYAYRNLLLPFGIAP